MSNRILGLFILTVMFGLGYGFYLIFFVKYTGILEITSNIDNYSVELYAKKVYQTFNFECKEKVCTIPDLSPFDYEITVTSPSYKNINHELSLKGKKTNHLNAVFEKDTKLTEIEIKKIVSDIKTTKDLAQEKIELIKLKREADYTINLGNLGFFYFKTNGNNLELYKKGEKKDTKLGTFQKVDKKDIQILKIDGDINKILISLKNRSYIYNLKLQKISEFKFVPKIKYIKINISKSDYIIITNIGAYTYNELSKELQYFYLFKDFVYFKDFYIGVIYKDEKNKFTNFSLKDNNKNLIIKYTPSTKNREIILESDMEITKIIHEGENKIYFYDNAGKKYELENY